MEGRHGNSDKEQLLLYVCKLAIAIDKNVCFMASWLMDPPVLYLRHRCLSTVFMSLDKSRNKNLDLY